MIVQTQLFIFYCVIDEYRASQAAQQQTVCLPKAGDTGGAGSIPGSGWSLEKERAAHSGTLAREIPWTEEPGGLQPMGSKELDTSQ